MTPEEKKTLEKLLPKAMKLSLGEFIKFLRKGLKWSRSYVGSKVGRTQQSLLTLEKEKNLPRPQVMLDLAKLFNIPVSVLSKKALEVHVKKSKAMALAASTRSQKEKDIESPKKVKQAPKRQKNAL